MTDSEAARMFDKILSGVARKRTKSLHGEHGVEVRRRGLVRYRFRLLTENSKNESVASCQRSFAVRTALRTLPRTLTDRRSPNFDPPLLPLLPSVQIFFLPSVYPRPDFAFFAAFCSNRSLLAFVRSLGRGVVFMKTEPVPRQTASRTAPPLQF
jgi:hypothetical protein